MALTKSDILSIVDIEVKEIEVPVWNDTVFIKQLTRGQQDEYMRRRFGSPKMSQKGKRQEMVSDIEIFGHDAWIASQGLCDGSVKTLFTEKDVEQLAKKNGEAIGFIAAEIISFSGMAEDVEVLDEVKN